MKLLKKYFKFLSIIFFDITYLYKNLLKWSISKILILIYSVIIWILFTLPFIILLFILFFFSDINWTLIVNELYNTWTIWIEVLSSMLENKFSFIIWVLFISIIWVLFYIWFSYSRILLIKISFTLLDWKKIKYFKKSYFNISNFIKYFQITLWNILFLSIPFFIFLFLILILKLIVWDFEILKELLSNSSINFIKILSFLFFILSFGWFLYIFFRIVFSYLIFVDSWNKEKAYFYIKKSISLTKWYKKILKIIPILFLFFLITYPFQNLLTSFENKQYNIENYMLYKKSTKENRESLNSSQLLYYHSLELEYGKEKNLLWKTNKYWILLILLKIFNIMFIYWLIEMIIVSFYKRELIK